MMEIILSVAPYVMIFVGCFMVGYAIAADKTLTETQQSMIGWAGLVLIVCSFALGVALRP